jgi:hypothetical protein
MHKALIALAAVLLSSQLQAATVFKCVDAAGKVTFTQNQNCPDSHSLDDVVSAHNPTISGSGPASVMATPRGSSSGAALARGADQPSARKGVTVVGGSAPQAGCNTGLSDQDLRTAKVRGEVVSGMSRKDVESIHGKPNSDSNARGGGTNTYWNDKYVSLTSVSFDSGGCVRSTYQSGHRP